MAQEICPSTWLAVCNKPTRVCSGPDTWWVHYPSASGGKQSPVDILTEETAADNNFGAEPLEICYHTPPAAELAHPGEDAEGTETKILVNTGATARVNVVNSRSCTLR